MNRLNYFIAGLIALVQFSCRDPFNPPEVTAPDPILIVEGVLVAGQEATSIRLSRSSPLDGFNTISFETGAIVTVEGRDNSVRTLANIAGGTYTSPGLNLTVGQDYRLRIVTATGREYESAFVTTRQTPVIDSVGFKQEDDGVRIYANTRDLTGNTRYYKWDYDETWEIRSFYYATVAYRGDGIVTPRKMPEEEVYRCWKYGSSGNILINSSEKLSSDVVFQAPIAFYPNGDERLGVRYSILLRQYAIDQAGYEFYELMKKNTENMGTVFDPQPTEISGNITCVTDPEELVLGYITASTISTKRYFINNSQLRNFRYDQFCTTENIKDDPDSIRAAFAGGGLMPYDALYAPVGPVVDTTYWLSAAPDCVDCTRRGGDLAMPSYW
ncbi:MAG: DUF4249 domain-containing protein [Chitinophagaceae bacterium]|nr:MAG: DUF4249 domain-containing protein [Chitinophagaceae bacterium]